MEFPESVPFIRSAVVTVMQVASVDGRQTDGKRLAMWLSVGVVAVALVVYLLIWYGPDMIARHDVGDVTGALRTLRLQQASDAARGRLLTLGAGLFAAGALIFTAQNYRLARKTLEVAEQGLVTDRYTRAIEQLGSKELDVRIGGIFALERVARDSARDHPTVMEVLAAFLREHSREPYVQPAGPTQPAGTSSRGTSPDVQAALTVIGRRDASRDQQRIDLSAAVIPAALLFDTDLTGVRLVGADLSSAILNRATLAGAKLADADFSHAALAEASLTGALLDGARFEGADLTGARFDTAPPGWDRDPQTGRLRRTVNRLPGSARDTMPSHPAIDRICR